jgi:hypothetical protein
MAQTVAEYLITRLREWGVEHLFGYPGDGINGLLAALGSAGNQPRFIQSRHEEMSAFQAVGYAKFTGRVGVCTATSGPGAIHLLNGLYDAKLDHVPVVAIVRPRLGPRARGRRAGRARRPLRPGHPTHPAARHLAADEGRRRVAAPRRPRRLGRAHQGPEDQGPRGAAPLNASRIGRYYFGGLGGSPPPTVSLAFSIICRAIDAPIIFSSGSSASGVFGGSKSRRSAYGASRPIAYAAAVSA